MAQREVQRPSRQTGTGSIIAGQSCCWQRTAEQVLVHAAWSASARSFDSTRRWQTQTQQSSAFFGSTAGMKVSVQSASVRQPGGPSLAGPRSSGRSSPAVPVVGPSAVREPPSCEEQASVASSTARRRTAPIIAWRGWG